MEQAYVKLVTEKLTYRPEQIEAALKLLDEGNTIPFIARYRKEATKSLDEVELREIKTVYEQTEKLEKKRTDIVAKITEQEKLTPKLKKALLEAKTLQQLEDLYLPFKQKRGLKLRSLKNKV